MSNTRLLRISEVLEVTGLRRSTLYSQIRRGEFPAPVKIGPRASAWRLDEVQDWIESLSVASSDREARG